jgi:hypothetical protein
VEHNSGFGRLDLVIQRLTDKCGVVQEYKRIQLTKKDKTNVYSDSQNRHLNKQANNALRQVETRLCCAQMLPHVIKLCEYGIVFLGPYCAVTGRLLE